MHEFTEFGGKCTNARKSNNGCHSTEDAILPDLFSNDFS
jgi:hypothetical protein